MSAFTVYIKYFRYETQKHSAHDYTLGTQACGQFSRNKQKKIMTIYNRTHNVNGKGALNKSQPRNT